MARLPYTNFHDINLDWIIKRVMKAFTPDNPPPYPVKSVNGETGNVQLTGFDIDYSDQINVPVSDCLDFLAEECVNIRDDMDGLLPWPDNEGNPGDILALGADWTPVWSAPATPVVDYDDLENRPEINSTTLTGDQSGADLGLLDAPGIAGTNGQLLMSNGDGTQSWATVSGVADMDDYAPVIKDMASGPIASFPDGADDRKVVSLIAEIVPIQAGSGDPSPSNPRAISGRAGMTIYHTANNLWDEANVLGSYNHSTGQSASSSNTLRNVNPIPVKENTSYCFVTAGGVYCFFYDENMTFISYSYYASSGGKAMITTPASSYYMNFYFYATVYDNGKSINYPDTDTTYHAYNGKSPILEAWGDIAGTVYGGTLDIVSGVLTVTHKLITLDGTQTQQNSKYDGTYNAVCRYNLSDFAKPFATTLPPKAISDKLKPINTSYIGSFATWAEDSNAGYTFTIQNNGEKVGIGIDKADTNIDNATKMNTWLSNNPITICYELNTYTTYQLTPEEVKTILGTNNIYSDSGDCSVTYRADTKLYILKVV